MLAFHIGGKEAEFVRVSILQDNGDGWFSADVEVIVGGFRGRYKADFNSWAFSDFYTELKALYKNLAGSAKFTSYEAQLELILTCSATGHIKIQGEAMDFPGTGNKLIFNLEADQTYVPTILRDLQLALHRYPVRTV